MLIFGALRHYINPNVHLFRSITCCFWDKNFFSKKWQNQQFLQNLENNKKFKVWCSLYITFVIPNFCPFCSISNRFRDKMRTFFFFKLKNNKKFKVWSSYILLPLWSQFSLTVSEIRTVYKKGSPDFHLYVFMFILILKDLQSFMKFAALVFELSCSPEKR